MKIAHMVVVTPHRAGIYETTRDLVRYERKLGVDARIVDPENHLPIREDRGVPIAPGKWVEESDVIVNHSGLGMARELNKPIVHVLHGRPHSSFLLTQMGKISILPYWLQIARDPRFKVFVTFWSDYVPYFENFFYGKRVVSIPAPVDLERWNMVGPAGYKFHGKGGDVNIVCTDMWRLDKDPFHVINAYMHYARNGGARSKFHIYGTLPSENNGWLQLKRILEANNLMGEDPGFVTGLDNVYRAADVVITTHGIATRTVREALACGATIVMDEAGGAYTPYVANPEKIVKYAEQIGRAVKVGRKRRVRNRKTAEVFFDPEESAGRMIDVFFECTR